jgi:hypothetical protein
MDRRAQNRRNAVGTNGKAERIFGASKAETSRYEMSPEYRRIE